nr:DUF6602 domain-containing protein [uncultured Vibrio sp.]
MANKVLQSITKDKLDNLFRAYDTSHKVFWDEKKGALRHPGEYGEFREKAARELISLFIPQTMKVSEGFIITSKGDVSTQCDLIVYDPHSCPNLVDSTHQKFFPVECVVAVGEIKSDISCSSEMSKILNKLAKVKELKESVIDPVTYRSHDDGIFCPTHRELDQIYTFVLAKSIPEMPQNGYKYENDIQHRHQHNFIVGIEGGHACYKKNDVYSYYYPQTEDIPHEQVSCSKEEQTISVNFGILLTSIFKHCLSATLLELNPLYYLADSIVSDSEEIEFGDFDFNLDNIEWEENVDVNDLEWDEPEFEDIQPEDYRS